MADKKQQWEKPDRNHPDADNERLSSQAQFSTYEEVEPEPANPPNGRQVEQTPGEASEGQLPSYREYTGQE